MKTKSILLTLVLVLTGQTVLGQAVKAGPYVAIMFSDGFRFEYQTRTIVFQVGNEVMRVKFDDATYLICKDSEGYRYASYRFPIKPTLPHGYAVFGLPKARQQKGETVTFSSETEDEKTFLITQTYGSYAQMREHEER